MSLYLPNGSRTVAGWVPPGQQVGYSPPRQFLPGRAQPIPPRSQGTPLRQTMYSPSPETQSGESGEESAYGDSESVMPQQPTPSYGAPASQPGGRIPFHPQPNYPTSGAPMYPGGRGPFSMPVMPTSPGMPWGNIGPDGRIDYGYGPGVVPFGDPYAPPFGNVVY